MRPLASTGMSSSFCASSALLCFSPSRGGSRRGGARRGVGSLSARRAAFLPPSPPSCLVPPFLLCPISMRPPRGASQRDPPPLAISSQPRAPRLRACSRMRNTTHSSGMAGRGAPPPGEQKPGSSVAPPPYSGRARSLDGSPYPCASRRPATQPVWCPPSSGFMKSGFAPSRITAVACPRPHARVLATPPFFRLRQASRCTCPRRGCTPRCGRLFGFASLFFFPCFSPSTTRVCTLPCCRCRVSRRKRAPRSGQQPLLPCPCPQERERVRGLAGAAIFALESAPP